MKGYIAVTAREWFSFLENQRNFHEVVFKRKNTKSFKVLSQGDPFFFLVKNDKKTKGERSILGMASFSRYEVLSVNDAWEKYGQANGDADRDSCIDRIDDMFHISKNEDKVGCIILNNFRVFNKSVRLSELKIDFQNSIVSGRAITDYEANLIIKNAFIKNAEDSNKSNFVPVELLENDEVFPEGRKVLIEHLKRERNAEVIMLAKDRYFEQHGTISCDICGFNFADKYGQVGEGYIEGHHTKPLSEYSEERDTKIEDIILVCSNCHRMIHRKRPWLAIGELEKLLRH